MNPVLMKEQTQEKASHPPGTESCGATGQPAHRSVDRKATGRNRKVKGWSPERPRGGRRGSTDSRRQHGASDKGEARRQPTGIGDHGKGLMDSCRNLGGPTASTAQSGSETPENKLQAPGARGCVPGAPRRAPSAEVGRRRGQPKPGPTDGWESVWRVVPRKWGNAHGGKAPAGHQAGEATHG